MVVCVSPDLVVSLGQRLTGSPKSKEKLCQYTSLLDLPSVCEETHVGRACKEQWRGYTLLRRQLLVVFSHFWLQTRATSTLTILMGKKIPILRCSCACMLAWWQNNVGKKVYRTLLPQQPLTAGGFCQALELKMPPVSSDVIGLLCVALTFVLFQPHYNRIGVNPPVTAWFGLGTVAVVHL